MLEKFVKTLDMRENELLLFTGNLMQLMQKLQAYNLNLKESLNSLLDTLNRGVGTLVLQTFNWDFCKGRDYDILHSKSQTGALGNIALKRADFKRTKHPIYSFAVSGKAQAKLCSLENKGAFDSLSPFAFMYENDAFMVIVDLPLQDSFTFVHFVEQNFNVSYRHNKSFSANYTDEKGKKEKRTYDMFVRNEGVLTDVNPLERILKNSGAMRVSFCENICIKKISLRAAYELIALDITQNKAQSLHKFSH
ncbi:AAC(3) family N-acetyltransferase [Campylobacter sp. VTCC 70190]|uniref:AAC(3) family N-acetyltransferase n=1 Tax=Campylobacter sp. VTCC 70190 TaxID=3392118 RepID=UPI00398F677A